MLVRLGDMAGVGTRAEAEDFRVDSRAAGPRSFQFFNHQNARSFGQHKAVPLGIKRAAGAGRVVVARGEGLHILKTGEGHFGDGRFGATGNDHVGIAVLDGAEGVADGVVRAGTGRGDRVVDTLQPVPYGKVAAGRVEHHLGDQKGGNAVVPLLRHADDLVFNLMQPADAAAENDAAAVRVLLAKVDAGIFHRGMAGDHGELAEAVHPLDLLAVLKSAGPLFGIPVADVSAELDPEHLGVDGRQRVNAALARAQELP